MKWLPGSGVSCVFANADLFVGAWRCPGERRDWAREAASHFAIELPRHGAHWRSNGAHRGVVDATVAALQSPGDEFLIASPSAYPQSSTLILLRESLAQKWAGAPPARTLRIDAQAALLHQRLLAASDPSEVERIALALTRSLAANSALATPAGTGRELPPSWRALAERIKYVLATRYPEPLSITDIATACGASPFHASRVFRAVVGETIHRHLNRLRLRVALLQVQGLRGQLTDVALAHGFSSHSHFTGAFRSEFGLVPSALAEAKISPLSRQL